MSPSDVQIGRRYLARIMNRLTPVRIDAVASDWWEATQLRTGKPVRINFVQQLVPAPPEEEPEEPAAADDPVRRLLGQLEAAELVLRESDVPLTTREMIAAMAAKGYWTSPRGKTPHATLHAAIMREIRKHGLTGRFRKAGRGKFTLRYHAQRARREPKRFRQELP